MGFFGKKPAAAPASKRPDSDIQEIDKAAD